MSSKTERAQVLGFDRDTTVNVAAGLIHSLVADEIKRDKEEAKGLIRRDGGRSMAEYGLASDLVDLVLKQLPNARNGAAEAPK